MIRVGSAVEELRKLAPGSVRCCVTSPPYWGLRDYGVGGQLGLEKTPEEYVENMVNVFREVRRVLADDGTLWLNLGDSYAANRTYQVTPTKWATLPQGQSSAVPDGLKPKDLVGIPWRVAFALQADGWYLRSDIVWSKPNPMPESVRDRPTKAHEYVFLLTKNARYYYDAAAVAEPAIRAGCNPGAPGVPAGMDAGYDGHRTRAGLAKNKLVATTRNRRSVWTIAPKPFKGAHFAVMPEALVEPCVLAGSAPGDTVLDPFAGSGTVGVVAQRHGREFVGVELNPEYAKMAEERIMDARRVL